MSTYRLEVRLRQHIISRHISQAVLSDVPGPVGFSSTVFACRAMFFVSYLQRLVPKMTYCVTWDIKPPTPHNANYYYD